MSRSLVCAWLVAALNSAAVAQTQASAEGELIARINALRQQGAACGERQYAATNALTHRPALSRAAPQAMRDARAALQRAGYQAARTEILQVSGAASSASAFDVLRQQYCAALLQQNFADIGAHKDGTRWIIVLAQPLLDATLGDWRSAGKAVLQLANQARAQARRCGDQTFRAAPPLAWNDALGTAALAHSKDMAQHDRLDHAGSDGSSVAARVKRQRYAYSSVGENIAAGTGSAQQTVDGWLASPGHCANLMNPAFTQMGVAYVNAPQSRYGIFWTQVLAVPWATRQS